MIISFAAHIIILDEDTPLFKIMLDYQYIKTTQAAGILLEIGGRYHYDCAICDRSRTPIMDTVKSLSIEAYRFFIL